ncbi:hypothetical protein [Chthonobacter albigriseus]|uniref:hypothetical protein n=1 Tax=Chthonobacter albigriseus TaxID=1683161 RepID=UPI0015EF1C6B|nr:hypothetical protein [Chthonobacter albigriseus]
MRLSLDDLSPIEASALMAHFAATGATSRAVVSTRLLALGLIADKGGRFEITAKGIGLVLKGYAPA